MKVNLYTDASIVARDGGRGAWAVVVPLADGTVCEKAAALRGSFRSSTVTELCAIVNGLHFAWHMGMIARGDQVDVWCDNMAAVWWANGLAKAKAETDPILIHAHRAIRSLCKRRGFTVHASHIPGHQRLDTDDPCAIWNQRADELCSAVRDGRDPTSFAYLETRIGLARERKARRMKTAA